ncbi:hypothetical protein P5V15_006190 [Pogonomyrmex californicus]
MLNERANKKKKRKPKYLSAGFRQRMIRMCKWMLPMNELRPSEKSMEILITSMPDVKKSAAFTRVIERLNPEKREREDYFDYRG